MAEEAERTIVGKLQDWRDEAVQDSDSWRDRAIESYRFYTGIGQWNEEDVDALDAEGRPHLTINLTMSIINTLIGHQINNDQQAKLFPRKGGTVDVAALGSELMKHTMDISGGKYAVTDCFQDGLISAIGILKVTKERIRDKINGELVVRKVSPFSVLYDQNAQEYDFNRAGRYIFEDLWLGDDEIQEIFHVDAKELVEATADPRYESDTFFHEDAYVDDMTERNSPERKNQYRVIEGHWRKWKKNVYLVNLSNWTSSLLVGNKKIRFVRDLVNKHNYELKESGEPDRWKIIERGGWVLYKTIFCGDKVLKHKVDPWNGISRFPYCFYYPYFADGYPFGVVDNLKDPQRELNKRISQELHILNTTANSGWIIGDKTDQRAYDDLVINGAKTGFVGDVSKFGGRLERINPTSLPQGHALMAGQHEEHMDRISGVDPNLRGITERKESGKALNIRQTATLTVAAVMFRNLNRTQIQLGEFLWDVIRTPDEEGGFGLYSQHEIESIVRNVNLKKFIGQDGQIDLSVLQSDDIGSYGIKVDTNPNTITARLENLELLLKIAQAYGPGPDGRPVIPPEFLIELSDIPQREELMERLQQLATQPPAIPGGGQPQKRMLMGA